VGALHELAHAQAMRALALAQQGQREAALECLQGVYRSRDELLALLERLTSQGGQLLQ
jgi:hypothetical protein